MLCFHIFFVFMLMERRQSSKHIMKEIHRLLFENKAWIIIIIINMNVIIVIIIIFIVVSVFQYSALTEISYRDLVPIFDPQSG